MPDFVSTSNRNVNGTYRSNSFYSVLVYMQYQRGLMWNHVFFPDSRKKGRATHSTKGAFTIEGFTDKLGNYRHTDIQKAYFGWSTLSMSVSVSVSKLYLCLYNCKKKVRFNRNRFKRFCKAVVPVRVENKLRVLRPMKIYLFLLQTQKGCKCRSLYSKME